MRLLSRLMKLRGAQWTAWALVLLISLAPVLAQVNQIPPKPTDPNSGDRPGNWKKGGGSQGGVNPIPPNGSTPPPPAPTDRRGDSPVQLLLIVKVDGDSNNDSGYEVIVTTKATVLPPWPQQPTAPFLVSGVTNKFGFVVLQVPSGALQLQVVGTDVTDMPVYGGQYVSIVLP